MLVPLHLKSDYSIAYGTASVDELAERLAGLGYRVAALTDRENLYGQVRFHSECISRGIRPITGVELQTPFVRRKDSRCGRVLLLARDAAGYGNLCRLVSHRHTARRAPLDDPLPLLAEHAEGLFILSDDPLIVERLALFKHLRRDRLGLLVVRPSLEEPVHALQKFSYELGIRLVADTEPLFLTKEDYRLHLLQQAVRQGKPVEEIEIGIDPMTEERWLRSPEKAAALFADLREAVKAAAEIAEECRFDLLSHDGLNAAVLSKGDASAEKHLRMLCKRAIPEQYPEQRGWTQIHTERLEMELSVFATLGFSRFMLVVAEILTHCKTNGIPAVIRGSAASSLTLYLLGGSPVDPLPLGLLFERFLHLGKSTWPDIDLDLPWHRRDDVIAWAFEHFGHDRVAMVAAHAAFGYRSALREGLKAYGAAPATIERLVGALPPDDLAVEEVDFLGIAAGRDKKHQDDYVLHRGNGDEALPDETLSLIRRLVGRPRHIATHPGGIVIGGSPLTDLLPLERAPKGVVVTQYDHVSIARLGLVKIDLLGNRCLSELEEALSLSRHPLPLRLQSIPPDDPPTLELIDTAQTIGCFQLESPAMRSLLARLPIRRQSDLIAALALIRPGAASGAVKSEYVRRARGEATPGETAFPVMDDRIGETYGLFLYEEDIMLLLHRTGGVSLAEADEFRRAIVESGGDKETLRNLETRFLEPLMNHHSRARLAEARKAWTVAARFAAYSFNKAHAASYARLAYCAAYIKTHHPPEFACSLLNHHQGLYPLRTLASELVRLGVELRGPHVNSSTCRSAIETCSEGGRAVRIGFDKIKWLSRRAGTAIAESRDAHGAFVSLRNLLERVLLNSREVAALVLSGACDGLPPLTAGDYPFPHEAALEHLRQNLDLSRLDSLNVPRPIDPDADRVRLYRKMVRVRNELQYLGMHLLAHPMALLRAEAGRYRCLTVRQAAAVPPGSSVRLAVTVAAMRWVPTSRGVIQFFTVEDETGLLEAVVLPAVYRRLGERITTPGPFLVEGTLRDQQGALHLEVARLAPFHQRADPFSS